VSFLQQPKPGVLERECTRVITFSQGFSAKIHLYLCEPINKKFLRGPGAVFSKSWPMSGGAAQFYRNKHLKVLALTIEH
jgi:hypothetical protein